jgi:2'-5' RNA ligase
MVKMYSSSERNHTICRHLFRKVCFRTQLTVKRLFGILTIATAFIIIQQRRENSAFPQWNEKLIHGRAEPQRTLHFPFRTGCPHDCGAYRHVESSRFGSILNDEQDFYRVTVEWYFGEPEKYMPTVDWKAQRNSSSYKLGINFQCTESFVRTFQAASRDLHDQATKFLSTPSQPTTIHPQRRMHVSLSYLCCLNSEEAKRAIAAIDDWTGRAKFDMELRFDEIQAWHESPNSVTTIVLVDEASQQTLMRINHDLNQHLHRFDIPIAIQREDQMPFHATVAGFRYGSNGESYDPTLNIEPQLSTIYNFVHQVSQQYLIAWNGPNGKGIRIQHKPKRSSQPSLHTFPLVDKEKK